MTGLVSLPDVVKEIGKPIVETGCGLLKTLLGKPCEIAGEMISDGLYRWQWERRIEILEKAQQLLNARGVNAKLLPKGFFLTYLQHAGEIEAIELQDLWAKLLAGAVETEANQHPAFVHVLKQLSVLDARVLGAVGEGNFRFKRSQKVSVKKEQRETIENTANFIGLSEPPPDAQLVFVAVGHLNELGLISVRFHAKKGTQFDALVGGEVHNEIETLEESGRTALTTFGAAFYAACVSNSIGFKPAKITDGWQLLNEVHELAYDTMSSASSAGKSADDALDQIASQQVYTE